MKRLKFPAFFIAMAVALVSAFAFSTPQKTNKLTTSYHYIGDFIDEEVSKPENWIAEPSSCPAEAELPCSISTELDRNDFDLLVGTFTNVADANAACTTQTYGQ
jgi:hypothetical protein